MSRLGSIVIFQIRSEGDRHVIDEDIVAIVIGEDSGDFVSLAVFHDQDDDLVGNLSENPFTKSRCLIERVVGIPFDASKHPRSRTCRPVSRDAPTHEEFEVLKNRVLLLQMFMEKDR